ncbi:MAG: sigma-70 family RNA polymerase sigma factor [Acidobacteria bacterium]|nr:sigma-70 family RNA polymerase sigma factor [Acidobacteriota bacterium]NIM60719.1 sigma-70 family RNA polymerase sigma factor [Acidobacteriota bacterium]NIO59539.1 sigma-70 family RNA polymerase sigma factor [Acidobacteriota bacterium]NIQ85525.1 sigma-70 family RNA polymerase sigma factor [Acidobacteriota bacterium]NIT11246.1 sigma-70 family RNA polymerase sigma factor [Acidobacteriota bacterium]
MAEEPESALATEMTAHRASILRYVRNIVGDRSAAEDLTQETLLRAHARRASLQDESRLLPWLYRIATNLCRDRFRQQKSRGKPNPAEVDPYDTVEQDDAVADTGPRLDQALDQDEMSTCVQSYLAELPDSYKAVIFLHDMEGMTNPEIAEMLGVSLPTVKIRIHRAREKLRVALDQACSFSSDERGVLVCQPKPDGPDSD